MAECRIHPEVPMPDPAVLTRLAALPTPALSDSMGRLRGARGLLPLTGKGRLVGPALTVQTRPGDNLVVHKAADLARPGEVLVVDAGGNPDRAIVGDLLCRYAASRGVTGMVVDGAVRDVAEVAELGMPLFARAVSHLGPYKNGPGEIRGQVSVGGMPVGNGDLIVADENGVLAIPRPRVAEVIAAAEALLERERVIVEAIDADAWDRSWVDNALDITWCAQEQESR
ncbi:MAG TPA: RraA family protein [Pseudonocardiaceae bacterium]|jgi:regulator of RNase E activity RraA|nr:RraA family protein [Pseudonocardiaceae bacterium]